MEIRIRTATPGDAVGIFLVKQEIRLPATADRQTQSGFLLGTSLEQYEYFIEHDDVLVAEVAGTQQIVGFSIALKHESVTNSILWQRAQEVRWDDEFRRRFMRGDQFVDARVAYYEQLGFLPDPTYRVYAKYLAFAGVQRILQTHEHLFTTIVREPFTNHAALPFLRVAGFENVGIHDEWYHEYGRIVSDVYQLERERFEEKLREGKFERFVAKLRVKGYMI